MSGRKMFLNIAVSDLNRSMAFFRNLGFGFNMQFTDANAACMIISEQAFVMLLTEPFFKDFTTKSIADTGSHTEALIALSCESRDEVERIVNTALASGGSRAMDPKDYGFMYGWSFYDPDGHHWEVMWMDEEKMKAQADQQQP